MITMRDGASDISVLEREELAYRLLTSLPRSRLACIQRRIAPLLQFDVVGSLPNEIALQIFSSLSSQSLLGCALVCKRWRVLTDDPSLWKSLCVARGWEWKQPSKSSPFGSLADYATALLDIDDDEGMGDEEDDTMGTSLINDDSGFGSMDIDMPHHSEFAWMFPELMPPATPRPNPRNRHSAPSAFPSFTSSIHKPNYKLLHLTHTRIHARFLSSTYRLSALQTRGGPTTNAHTNTIYCLQLYTHPLTGIQSLFTGSKDRTIREWNLESRMVVRVIDDVHESSVLSLCAADGYIASGGSDRKVAIWELETGMLMGVIADHEDSVLCVRFNGERLASCSKDRTVRTYKFPELTPQLVLGGHRAAVNAVSMSQNLIVSGSGDRSIRLWDAQVGTLLATFENHHSRGIASIDFKPPYLLSGSSDKHIRLFDITTLQGGWSTSPEYDHHPRHAAGTVCQACGAHTGEGSDVNEPAVPRCMHGDLVRSVALHEDFVLSGSYDSSLKVWDRKTGALVADLTGGHTGRIFCIGFDCTKIVSCGEDQRICIWDFSHGIDTSFIKL